MLKIKRIFSIVLATLVLFLVSPFVVVAQADDKTTDLYILSKQCPQEYVDYANEIIGSLLGGQNISNPCLGKPFSFCNMDSDIYYFPVYSNGLITHIPSMFRKKWSANGCIVSGFCSRFK